MITREKIHNIGKESPSAPEWVLIYCVLKN